MNKDHFSIFQYQKFLGHLQSILKEIWKKSLSGASWDDTLDSGINVAPGINIAPGTNVAPGTFDKDIKNSP